MSPYKVKGRTMFLKFLESGLKNKDSGLGDRSKYIGSSDIGQCPKKSYLSKIKGQEYALQQLLIFERGHVAEGIVRNGLQNNSNKVDFHEQVEINGEGNLSFLRSHIDFLVNFPREDVIIECKSISSPLPNDEPRLSWIYQVQFQMGLLKPKTSKPIRAIIVAFNLNTGVAESFDVAFDKKIFQLAIERGEKIWESVQNKDEPDGEISDLCPYCPFKGQCNTLRKSGEELPDDVKMAVAKYIKLQGYIKEAQQIKASLKDFFQAAEIQKGIADEHVVYLSNLSGREKVDIYALKQKYPNIAKEIIKKGDGFSQLKIA